MRYICLIVSLFFQLSQAASLFVKTNGNDSTGNGSSGNPWHTIAKAVASVAPGDTVTIGPGYWDEYVIFSTSGTASNPITWTSSGPTTNAGTVYVSGSYQTFSNAFEMTFSGTNTFNSPFRFSSVNYGISNVNIINMSFHDVKDIYPASLIDFESNSGLSNKWSNIVISNCSMVNYRGIGITLRGQTNLCVNNYLSNSFGADAFNAFGHDHVFRGNRCYEINSKFGNNEHPDFIQTFGPMTLGAYNTYSNLEAYNILIEQNLCWDTDVVADGFSNATSSATQTIPAIGNGQNIQKTFTTQAGLNWVTDLGITAQIDANNYMEGRILSYSGTTVIINVTYVPSSATPGSYSGTWSLLPTGTGGAVCQLECNNGPNPATVHDWTFRNNLFIGCSLGGSVDIPNCRWYNNTFYRCTPDNNVLNYGWFDPASGDPRGLPYGGCVSNNAFIECGYNTAIQGWYGAGTANGYVANPKIDIYTNCNYNFVCNASGAAKTAGTIWDKTNDTLVFQFYEPNGLNGGAAKLINTNGWWKPMLSSVLIDSGFNTPANTNDYTGAARPQGTITDIGAYEFDPTLKVWLDFDQSGFIAGKVLDITGYGNDGWQTFTNWPTATNGVFGTTGGSWVTNVTTFEPPSTTIPISAWISLTNIVGIEYLTNGTVSFWAKPSTGNTPADTYILDNGSQVGSVGNVASNSWNISGQGHPYYELVVYDGAASYRELARFPNQETDKYHLYTMTFNCTNNTSIAYYDGVAYNTNTVGLNYLHVYGFQTYRWMAVGRLSKSMDPHTLLGGGDWAAGFYQGALDDVRLYNRDLPATEIAGIYLGNGVVALPSGDGGGGSTTPLSSFTIGSGTLRVGGGTLRFGQ